MAIDDIGPYHTAPTIRQDLVESIRCTAKDFAVYLEGPFGPHEAAGRVVEAARQYIERQLLAAETRVVHAEFARKAVEGAAAAMAASYLTQIAELRRELQACAVCVEEAVRRGAS